MVAEGMETVNGNRSGDAGLKDWMVGLEVKMTTSSGDVNKSDTLKDASNAADGAHVVVLVRTATLAKVEVVNTTPEDKSAVVAALRRPLPPLPWEQIREREKVSNAIIRDYQRRHDIGIPDRGVEVFRALSKTLPCRWGPQDSIIILDTLRLTPPYTADDLKAIENDVSALSRVKLVLEKERAKLFTS
ncbi:Protein LSM12-like B [Porphyridium purpureum]|uniref:Protein LSM12-like B n=1 Tax=Porphyridium purpureum TaxID=35688 RepID=A0A5J4YTA3_PORPP|nr:Protein LSM12-like B [Porphyridium purpureum]|eukprot:POR7194..scf227_4